MKLTSSLQDYSGRWGMWADGCWMLKPKLVASSTELWGGWVGKRKTETWRRIFRIRSTDNEDERNECEGSPHVFPDKFGRSLRRLKYLCWRPGQESGVEGWAEVVYPVWLSSTLNGWMVDHLKRCMSMCKRSSSRFNESVSLLYFPYTSEALLSTASALQWWKTQIVSISVRICLHRLLSNFTSKYKKREDSEPEWIISNSSMVYLSHGALFAVFRSCCCSRN